MDKDINTPGLFKKLCANRWAWLAGGVLVGMITFIAYRAAIAKDTSVHYHANFAVYVNGKQEKFEGPGFYEEVAACNTHDHDDVKSHAHMHGNVNHAVHVHASGITWGDFFANLGYTLGDTVLSDGKNVYSETPDGQKLHFILNGKHIDTIANQIIKSEDVLLIEHGQENDLAMQEHHNAIPKDAHQLNVTKDPSACSGGQPFNMQSRLKEALGLTD
jgi:hypothetical protein